MRSQSDATVFQAIACPTRRSLLDLLGDGERNVTALVGRLRVSQSAVSQQLLVLKNAGLVDERQDGRFRYYRLSTKPLTEVETWLAQYRASLERQLDRLGEVLDALEDEQPRANQIPAAIPKHRPAGKRRRTK